MKRAARKERKDKETSSDIRVTEKKRERRGGKEGKKGEEVDVGTRESRLFTITEIS
jgi:hypothetical protein